MANSTLTVAQMEQALVDSKELHEAKTTAEIVAGVDLSNTFLSSEFNAIQERMMNAFKNGTELNYIVSGDSTRHSATNRMISYYTEQLAKINVTTSNNSKAGQSIANWLANVNGATLQQAIDATPNTGLNTIMEFSYIINDRDTNNETQMQALIVDAITAYKTARPDALVFLVTSVQGDNVEELRGATLAAATELNIPVVDAQEIMIPYHTLSSNDYYIDVVHPSQFGSQRIVNYILDTILPSDLKSRVYVTDKATPSGDITDIEVEVGRYLYADGALNASSGWRRTPLVPVIPNSTIDIIHTGNAQEIMWFDEDRSHISSRTGRTNIPVPSSAAFIGYNLVNNNVWVEGVDSVLIRYVSGDSAYLQQLAVNEGLSLSLPYKPTDFVDENGEKFYTAAEIVAGVDVATMLEDGYDVIVLAGQSNMVGVDTEYNALLDYADNRIYEFNSNDQVQLATDALDNVGASTGTIGLGITLAKKYLASQNANRKVLLVPVARSSTGFSTNHWNEDDAVHEYAINQANKALALNENNRLVAIMWNQGENDYLQTLGFYARSLRALVRSFRTRITNATNTPFISAVIPSFSINFSADVNSAIDELSKTIDNFHVVDVSNLQTVDTVHYDARSTRELGARYASLYEDKKYTFNLKKEKDSAGHWIFGEHNDNFLDEKSGKILTVFDQPPTINTNFVRLADAGANMNALVTDIPDELEQTIIMVVRLTAGESAMYVNTVDSNVSSSEGVNYYVVSDDLKIAVSGAAPFSATGQKTGVWQFLCISQTASNHYVYWGNSASSSITSVSRSKTASTRTMAIGNRYVSGFSHTFDVAEFCIINEALTPRLINEAYQRSAQRMLQLGITLD